MEILSKKCKLEAAEAVGYQQAAAVMASQDPLLYHYWYASRNHPHATAAAQSLFWPSLLSGKNNADGKGFPHSMSPYYKDR